MSCVLSFFGTNVACELTYSHSTCMESLTSHSFRDHVITCKSFLLPHLALLVSFFFSFTALLLKLYTLLVRFKSFINVFMNSYIIQLYYLYVGLNKRNIREALVIYWDVLVS